MLVDSLLRRYPGHTYSSLLAEDAYLLVVAELADDAQQAERGDAGGVPELDPAAWRR